MIHKQYFEPFNFVQKMNLDLFKNVISKICLQIIYLMYMYKQDLAFNDLYAQPTLMFYCIFNCTVIY